MVWSLAVICSRRRPVRSAISTYGISGGARSAVHELVRGHVAAKHERALLEVAGQLAARWR